MAGVSVSIDASDFQRWASGFGEKAQRAVQRAVHRSAFLIERMAKLNVTSGPYKAVDTGRLRSSIAAGSTQPMVMFVKPHVEYGIYVHEGTRFMRPRPFLFAAAEGVEADMDAIMLEELRALD